MCPAPMSGVIPCVCADVKSNVYPVCNCLKDIYIICIMFSVLKRDLSLCQVKWLEIIKDHECHLVASVETAKSFTETERAQKFI